MNKENELKQEELDKVNGGKLTTSDPNRMVSPAISKVIIVESVKPMVSATVSPTNSKMVSKLTDELADEETPEHLNGTTHYEW